MVFSANEVIHQQSKTHKKQGCANTASTPLNPNKHNKKPTCISQVGFMELMTGFEPVTSSLPRMRSTC